MSLSNKILYCRKKAGLSQEALAELIGVSRQAISKWETDEAVPEISKLISLARAFDVTTDWLLSDDETEPPCQGEGDTEQVTPSVSPSSGTDAVGMIGRLINRYGWLLGVYIAVSGVFFMLLGIAAKAIAASMMPSKPIFGLTDLDPMLDSMFSNQDFSAFMAGGDTFAASNPVSMLATFVIIIGAVMTVAGIILAIYLKKRGKNGSK